MNISENSSIYVGGYFYANGGSISNYGEISAGGIQWDVDNVNNGLSGSIEADNLDIDAESGVNNGAISGGNIDFDTDNFENGKFGFIYAEDQLYIDAENGQINK